MNQKLTLTVDQKAIENAIAYAKLNNTTLSELIDSYLNSLPGPTTDDSKITPSVESLSGVIELPEGSDEKAIYREHLTEKHK